jgi:hypothetical protein
MNTHSCCLYFECLFGDVKMFILTIVCCSLLTITYFYHSKSIIELGVAMRGMGREPINSWLPLYIHSEHWKLVCPQLKPIIGHFVTLDPLGYNENQLDSLFLVRFYIVVV